MSRGDSNDVMLWLVPVLYLKVFSKYLAINAAVNTADTDG